jgi:anti-sigma B factor antagonist
MPSQWLQTEDRAGLTLVRFHGSEIHFDTWNTPLIFDELNQLLEEAGRCRLALDLSNVVYLFSDPLGKLLALHKRLNLVGGRLILFNLKPEVEDVFRITLLDSLFDIRPDEQSLGVHA